MFRLLVVFIWLSGCTKPVSRTFAPLAQSQSFPSATVTEATGVTSKTDVLFVIDNSGSMDPAQANIIAAMNRLIDRISGDACFAVTTTSAYLSNSMFNDPRQLPANHNLIRAKMNRKYCTRRDDGTYNDLEQLKADMRMHANVGINGSGSEMALNSIMEFIYQNETSYSSFPLFRRGSNRIIFVVSDEENQSRQYQSLSPLRLGVGTNSYWHSTTVGVPHPNCSREYLGYQYGLTSCANFSLGPRLNVGVFKNYLDVFFRNLDQSDESSEPKYLISFIIHQELDSLRRIRKFNDYADPGNLDAAPDQFFDYDVFEGADEIAELVGNGSSVNDIGAPTYDAIFEDAVEQVVEVRTVFTVEHTIDRSEPVYVVFQCIQNGARTPITEYSIEANNVFVPSAIMQSLIATCTRSEVFIDYTPENLSPN